MTVVDSRLGPGTLTLGTTDHGSQISNVRLVPDVTTTDGTKTLGTPSPAAEIATTWKLSGTAIQDWESSAGFVEYCRLNAGDEVAFVWSPKTSTGITYEGTCVIVPVEIGGDIDTQNTTNFEFSVVGDPTRVVD